MEKIYQIKRSNLSSTLADNIIISASRSNNSSNDSSRVTLDDMIGYINIECALFPSTNRGVAAKKVNDYHLIVNQDQNLLLEIIEMELYNDVPTLDTYNNLN
jgi:hypothetical protein